MEIACFITPHGFGHATRMTAVLEALQKRIPDLHPHLFTTVQESLFAETLEHFNYHPLSCDIGLVQKDGLHADIPATIKKLQNFLPFNTSLLNDLAEKIKGCRLVLCDIAPLGIAVAQRAEIKSVLIENFTWDWIYEAYLPQHPELQTAISYLASQYQQADIHIRCEPACGQVPADLKCSPIFRRIHANREKIRRQLQCKNKTIVLITMGGVELELPFIHQLSSCKGIFFILTGQQDTRHLESNLLLLARDSEFYHPDLINSADLVICKSGYSTIAECTQAGVSVIIIGRARFPESAILEKFSISKLNARAMEQKEFLSGLWLKNLKQLLSTQKNPALPEKGADAVAKYLQQLILS